MRELAPDAAAIVERLRLEPHVEGGWFRETHRDEETGADRRARSTLIYFLLPEGRVSAWHRVDAVEYWLWHAGAPLALTVVDDDHGRVTTVLGADLDAGESPHAVVPAHAWQMAETAGAWTLVSCVVAPGFEFSGFELAPEGWRPAD